MSATGSGKRALVTSRAMILLNAKDAAAVFPELWPNPDAARQAFQRGRSVTFPDKYKPIRGCHTPLPALKRLDYQKAGAGCRPAVAWFDPEMIPDPVSFLKERLTNLAWAKVEAVAAPKAECSVQPIPIAASRKPKGQTRPAACESACSSNSHEFNQPNVTPRNEGLERTPKEDRDALDWMDRTGTPPRIPDSEPIQYEPAPPVDAAQLPDPGNTVHAADEGSYLPPYCQPAQKGQAPPKAEQHARTRELVGPWVDGVARLQSMPPLAGFSFHRWARVCLDCAELVERWGAEMQQLGWTVEDAFGIHPKVPGTAVQCYGLGVLLNGGKVVELTAAGATIERPNGIRHKFIKPPMQSAVPIWTAGDRR